MLACSGGDFEADSDGSEVTNPEDSSGAPSTTPSGTQSPTPSATSSTSSSGEVPGAPGTGPEPEGPAVPESGTESEGSTEADDATDDVGEGTETPDEPEVNPEPMMLPEPMGPIEAPEPDPEMDLPVTPETPAPEEVEVPMTDHCAAVAVWDAEWLQWEEEVLLLVNDARSATRSCGARGSFEPSDPLESEGALTCAARLHSVDMFERDFFAHDNPDGVDPAQRVTDAGYDWSRTGENIAYGYSSPQAVMDGWMSSDGHCANIMNAGYTQIGIGYYPGDTSTRFSRNAHYWTQNFGTPMPVRPSGGGGGGFGR